MWPAPSRLNPHLSRPAGLGQKHRHAAQHPLQRALQRPNANAHTQVLPQQNVVLKVNRHAAQLEMQHGHQLALNVIGDSGKRLRMRNRSFQHRNWHFASIREVELQPIMHWNLRRRNHPEPQLKPRRESGQPMIVIVNGPGFEGARIYPCRTATIQIRPSGP
jgi:hypothetical protein